ncbi:hypothetical protein SYNPS1DRAFT_25166 [Syncephalis pseudoplumigaleata]|uniref:Tyrosinase copper-binding domain-containing protein n=1 Tax=Syncephalis pseudoplumigaleata TaxID=1712513 RepID=A0A4P9YSI1_9FUNG|nr:hypothetical protein SYNPS1DRAFT_25166 [Syncephalis pseudoplumigaleata]|eukprot:RKP22903.1 hypothetical protein SYNPS1DRAFT_25166 [Syncephalis pseudoplumigaleata]
MIRPVDAHTCKRIRQRQEIRTLTQAQRESFFHAIRYLQSGPKPTRYDKQVPRLSQRFVERHYHARVSAHGWPWFLTWHRAFIREFEASLQEVDPDIMLPYWDWSYDSQAPELSPVFRSGWFGGNGRPSDGCVADGHFASWRPAYPEPHCLRRKWNQGDTISAFHPPETLEVLVRNATHFEQFRTKLEAPTHGQVHNSIGGDMPSMYSPNEYVRWCIVPGKENACTIGGD